MTALSMGLPVLALTHYYGVAVGGAYAFSMRLLSAPMGLVTGALRQVLLQRASQVQHQGERLWPLFLKSTMGLFGLVFLPAAVLCIWSPHLFAWVFGSQWSTAGEFARWLVLWLAFGFCNTPAFLCARIIRIQRTLFLYNVALLVARVLALVIGGMYLTALQSIVLLSVVGILHNVILILTVGRVLRRREDRLSVARLREDLFGDNSWLGAGNSGADPR